MARRTIMSLTRQSIWQGAPEGDDLREDYNIPWSYATGTPYDEVTWQTFSSAPYAYRDYNEFIEFTPVNDPGINRNFYTFNRWGHFAAEARTTVVDMLHYGRTPGAGYLVYAVLRGPPRPFTVWRIPIGGDTP